MPEANEDAAPFVDDGSHLDGFRAADIGDGIDIADDVISADEAEQIEAELNAPEVMNQDDFWQYFHLAFAVPGALDPDFRPVAIQPEEERDGRKASDALYRLLDRYYPALLTNNGGPLIDAVTVGSFIFGKVMVVRMIMIEKRAARMRDVTPEGAGQGGPDPAFKSRRSEAGPEPQGGVGPMEWMDQGEENGG